MRDMESNFNNAEPLPSEAPLDEPHFDEEATLMSARPVVPLHEVEAEERFRRHFLFPLLLVVALMIGLFGAALVYRQRAEDRSSAGEQTSTPASEADARAEPGLINAGEASSNSDVGEAAPGSNDPAPVLTGQAEDPSGRQEPRNDGESAVPNRHSPAISGKPAGSAEANQPNQNEIDAQEEVEIEMRRAERRDARRLKRREEREARQQANREIRANKGRSDNDLLRIREIFEGPPRP